VMVEGVKARGHRAAYLIDGPQQLALALAGSLRGGDMVVCLGAGDITKWAANLAGAIGSAREPVA